MDTPVTAGRAAVIGGSIAGCAAAIAASKAGLDVTLYERSTGDLAERGFGICLPEDLLEECVTAGYIDRSMPTIATTQRAWLTRADGPNAQRELWRQPSRMLACNWGLLWDSLRSAVPEGVYRSGHTVTGLRETAEGAVLQIDGDREHVVDLVIGADGYKSVVRKAIAPDAAPEHAGYITWRGVVDVDEVENCDGALATLDEAFATVGFPGGHAIFYPIPGPQGSTKINWLVYSRPPETVEVGLSMSYAADATLDKLSSWFEELVDAQLPPQWAQLVHCTPQAARAFQPIFDLGLDRCARSPFLLAGDAGTITRPHTASGATKALQDALCLEKTLREAESWDTAIASYDRQRNAAGNELVELGRKLGHHQVESTPDWSTMDADRMRQWAQASVAGYKLYIYANTTD